MMKYVISLTIILLIGCNNKKVPDLSENSEPAKDTEKYENKPYPEVGLQKKNVYSEDEKKAFGNILFGMSKKQVDKAWPSPCMIGDYEYTMQPQFLKSDSLYKLYFNSRYVKYDDYYNELPGIHANLVTVINSKYGPAKNEKVFPKAYEIDENKILETYTWDIGDKVILIGISKLSKSEYYYACLMTYSKTLSDKKRNEDLEESHRETIKSQQKIEADKNKF